MSKTSKFISVLLAMFFLSAVVAFSQVPSQPDPVENDELLAGCEYDYPPYCIAKESGEADGFAVELMRAAAKAVGRKASFKAGYWADMKQELVDGKIKVLPLVARTEEREKLYDFTFPYLTMHGAIIVRGGNTDIRSASDLKGKEVLVLKGDYSEEYMRQANLGAIIVSRKTFSEAMRELSSGKYDALVIQRLLSLQLMKEYKISNLKIATPLPDFVQYFCFAVRRGDKDMLSLLNEGLSIVMADGTFHQLQAKWFSPLKAMELNNSRIIVGGDDNRPPWEFIDSNGLPAGLDVDLTRALAKQIGVSVDIQLGPWNKILEDIQSGRIDIVQGMSYSLERDKVFCFSPPHTVVDHVIVTRKNSDALKGMTDLKGKSILAMKGDIMCDLAVKDGYGKQLVLTDSQEDALRLLSEGKGDCALVSEISALYFIDKNSWKNLKLSGAPVLSSECCYSVLRGREEEVLESFISALAVLKKTGGYREIQSKWIGPYEKYANYRSVIIYVAAVAISMVLLLLASVIWSRSLKKIVLIRTQELIEERNALSISEARFRSYFDLPLHGIAITSLEKGWIEVNDRICSILGYSRDEILQMTWSEMTYPDDLAADIEQLERMLSGQVGQYQVEKRFIRKDGNVIWINLAVGCVRQADGKVDYFTAVLEDITERKLAEKERGYLSAIVESSEDAIIGKTLNGIISSWNRGAERIYGYSSEEAVGKPISVLFPAGHPDEMSHILDRIRRGEAISAFETVRTRKDGSKIDVSLTISPILSSNGEITGAATIARDISERKRNEAALFQSQSMLKAAMDHSTAGIAIADAPDGVLRYVNDAGLFIRGGDRQSVINGVGIDKYVRSWQLLDIDGSPLKADEVPLTRAILFGETCSREFIIRRADNDDRIVSANAAPIKNEQGKVVAGIVVFTDITEHKQLELDKLKIEEQSRQLQKAESLGRMAGAIAHHFNNQLHVVIGYLEMVIAELPPGDSHAENLAAAMQAAKKASEVSVFLITYLGQKRVKLEVVDIAELCRMSLPILQEGKPRDVVLELELPSPSPVIRGDVKQIQQILSNLVSNAWESISDKAGTIHLGIKTVSPTDIPASHRFPVEWIVEEQRYACLEVMDSGCGIQAEDMDKLFDPFFSTKFTGRGLGLPVVLGIVKSHKGVITVENKIGGGSVFSVFFPLSESSDKSDRPERSDKPGKSPVPLKVGTVLLVEDDEAVREITENMLANLGFTVLQAKDGLEAVEIFGQHKDKITCVLCDLTMPRMGGWETISALRAIRHDLPVVLASGYDEASVMVGEHPELPDFFLNKPYEFAKLENAIGHVLARKTGKSKQGTGSREQ